MSVWRIITVDHAVWFEDVSGPPVLPEPSLVDLQLLLWRLEVEGCHLGTAEPVGDGVVVGGIRSQTLF